MLTFLNIMAAAMHSLDFMTGMSGGKGVILDFVGQCQSTSSDAETSADEDQPLPFRSPVWWLSMLSSGSHSWSRSN
jgi:hypothetical protein